MHGMREGPTAPRVLLTADPAHFPSFCFRIPQIRAYTHTHTHPSSSIEPYAAAPEPCIRDARSTISISLMMNLQAWIDDLRHRTIGMIDFKQSGVNIPVVSAESN